MARSNSRSINQIFSYILMIDLCQFQADHRQIFVRIRFRRRKTKRGKEYLKHLLQHADFVLTVDPVEVLVADGPVDGRPRLVEPVEIHYTRDRRSEENMRQLVIRTLSQIPDNTYNQIIIVCQI